MKEQNCCADSQNAQEGGHEDGAAHIVVVATTTTATPNTLTAVGSAPVRTRTDNSSPRSPINQPIKAASSGESSVLSATDSQLMLLRCQVQVRYT